jgi:hypothetical protein
VVLVTRRLCIGAILVALFYVALFTHTAQGRITVRYAIDDGASSGPTFASHADALYAALPAVAAIRRLFVDADGRIVHSELVGDS